MITLADVQAYDWGLSTYSCTFNDEEFNLIVLLLGSSEAREIFADYATNSDFADSLLADTLEALNQAI